VVRDHVDGEPGKTVMHTSFLSVGLFPEGFLRGFADALRVRVDGLRARYGRSGTATAAADEGEPASTALGLRADLGS
jgi:hypothetical protein